MKILLVASLVFIASCKKGDKEEFGTQPAPAAEQPAPRAAETPDPAGGGDAPAPEKAAQAGPDTKEKETEAAAAAEKWLALVDEGKYPESWDEAAGFFRGAVTRQQWQQSLEGVRKPLGKTLKRELASSQYATQLPGAPDGQYVVLQFDTSFENKKSAVETVTPMMDKDGRWRVSGYFIK